MVLTDVLSHFDVIVRIGENRPDYDEVTAGICSMFETGNIPLWLTLAVRVFLDIHHELEGETRRGYQELESITKVFVDLANAEIHVVPPLSFAFVLQLVQYCIVGYHTHNEARRA
jgi:hypothetical protein